MSIDYKSFWNKSDKRIYEAMVGSEPESIYWQHLNALVAIRTGNRNKWLSIVIAAATVLMAIVTVVNYLKPSPPPTLIYQPPPQATVTPADKDSDIDPLKLFTP